MKKRITLISILISIYIINSASFEDSYFPELPLFGHINKLTDYFTEINGMGKSNQEKPYVKKVRDEGYDFEEHKIITEDGYILTAWRIPCRIREPFKQRITRKPVLLQHGLLDTSYTWLMLNSTNGLALLLAEEGYDVWLTNSRGNTFSNEHVDNEYDSNTFYSKFWDFSFHEMAAYDLVANVNYIKRQTGYEKIIYIGHSQGTIQYFINYMLNPTFIDSNIEKFVSIGTVTNVFNTVNIY
jgi:lysosomal acid lipase/cholesteryl ester hydrolase